MLPRDQLPVVLQEDIDETHPMYAMVVEFVLTFTPMDIKAYNTAKDCLKTSFDLLRCNGFLAFLAEKKKKAA